MSWKEPAAQKKKQATERKGIHNELSSCSLYLYKVQKNVIMNSRTAIRPHNHQRACTGMR